MKIIKPFLATLLFITVIPVMSMDSSDAELRRAFEESNIIREKLLRKKLAKLYAEEGVFLAPKIQKTNRSTGFFTPVTFCKIIDSDLLKPIDTTIQVAKAVKCDRELTTYCNEIITNPSMSVDDKINNLDAARQTAFFSKTNINIANRIYVLTILPSANSPITIEQQVSRASCSTELVSSTSPASPTPTSSPVRLYPSPSRMTLSDCLPVSFAAISNSTLVCGGAGSYPMVTVPRKGTK